MHDRDCLHRFVFEHYPIRGHLVHLDAAWRALIEHRAYPDAIRDLLGRSRGGIAAARRDDQIRRRTVAAAAGRRTRAPAAGPVHQRARRARTWPAIAAHWKASRRRSGIGALIGTGNLTVTLETDDGAQRYQGIVPIEGARLAESLAAVFPEFGAVADAAVAACR